MPRPKMPKFTEALREANAQVMEESPVFVAVTLEMLRRKFPELAEGLTTPRDILSMGRLLLLQKNCRQNIENTFPVVRRHLENILLELRALSL